ncbi:hypothetical protein SAMD00023353_10600250 [Rosellinia necatrix]|uniref:Uncharacterized protein n=1 Tax=Rosellinia necatrix TaxID=77044 RepID=A0A1S8ABM5_ROSNE|nr:hypothetical protein SAMD00023353_10600250 [Rosellinia necatrix]
MVIVSYRDAALARPLFARLERATADRVLLLLGCGGTVSVSISVSTVTGPAPPPSRRGASGGARREARLRAGWLCVRPGSLRCAAPRGHLTDDDNNNNHNENHDNNGDNDDEGEIRGRIVSVSLSS